MADVAYDTNNASPLGREAHSAKLDDSVGGGNESVLPKALIINEDSGKAPNQAKITPQHDDSAPPINDQGLGETPIQAGIISLRQENSIASINNEDPRRSPNQAEIPLKQEITETLINIEDSRVTLDQSEAAIKHEDSLQLTNDQDSSEPSKVEITPKQEDSVTLINEQGSRETFHQAEINFKQEDLGTLINNQDSREIPREADIILKQKASQTLIGNQDSKMSPNQAVDISQQAGAVVKMDQDYTFPSASNLVHTSFAPAPNVFEPDLDRNTRVPIIKTEPREGSSDEDIPLSTIRDKKRSGATDPFPNLRYAMTSTSMDNLGRHQSMGIRILEDIAKQLSADLGCADAIQWSKSVNNLMQKGKKPQTLIGVAGNTGHGKSSCINALLDESKLVPTSCFRACTAVVTEIRWNEADEPESRYRAEIEFISAEDWNLELSYIFHDLNINSGEISTEADIEQSDVAVAWAKIQAVYPNLSKQDFGKISQKTLAEEPAVKQLLGTVKSLARSKASDLYDAVQVFIDSKRKTRKSEGKDTSLQMEFWPLIKVVRIYTKAEVLSSGAVIVDLPGVKDSNAARSAVAGKYIEKCHGLWVVSDITRAVDDQAAQELLGTRFKRQLKLDGSYSTVTFICSKTDNIQPTEVANDFGLREVVEELAKARASLTEWESTERDRIQDDDQRQEALFALHNEIERCIDEWDNLALRQNEGKSVHPSAKATLKRKSSGRGGRSRKRQRVVVDDTDNTKQNYTSAGDFWDRLEQNMPQPPQDTALTQEAIQSVMNYLESQKQVAEQARDGLLTKIEKSEELGRRLDDEVTRLQEHFHTACIAARNDESRGIIRNHFALGLKDLDQEDAQRANPEGFDPTHELRDYAAVGRSLPVFCVSSRAYQSLMGGKSLEGFGNLEATEVPQLKKHLRDMTEPMRISSSKSFLNDLFQLLTSLHIWSIEPGREFYLTDREKKDEVAFMTTQVNKMVQGLTADLDVFAQNFQQILDTLFTVVSLAADRASKNAVEIARRWPSQQKGDGGLPFGTYRATCRRGGAYKGRGGFRDFNEELVDPLIRNFSETWDLSFSKRVPEAFDELKRNSDQRIMAFCNSMNSRLESLPAFSPVMNMLRAQYKTQCERLEVHIDNCRAQVRDGQRDANRCFTTSVATKLGPRFKEIGNDTGPGVFKRMQEAMLVDIKKYGGAVIKASVKKPKLNLEKLRETIENDLKGFITEMQVGMKFDYTNLVQGAEVSKDARVLRERMAELIKAIDGQF
ncbi:hypothetical protein F5Y16DRAFT_231082 [Xylariaceae sp. FL0255]|nr:hypothetical protein F5Y16DRAFT_231082 [Xylariaceae sp. FL0255]